MSAGCRRVRRQLRYGFTLIELVVSMAVVAIVSVIAFEILLEARSTFARPDSDSSGQLVLAQLRADLRASIAPSAAPGFWNSGDLYLTDHPAGTVVIFRRDRRLFRAVSSASASVDPKRARLLVNDVVQWRWRKRSSRVVELEFGILVGEPLGARRGAAGAPTVRWRTVVHRATIASRGGVRSWL